MLATSPEKIFSNPIPNEKQSSTVRLNRKEIFSEFPKFLMLIR
jgi:hypothetical protein